MLREMHKNTWLNCRPRPSRSLWPGASMISYFQRPTTWPGTAGALSVCLCVCVRLCGSAFGAQRGLRCLDFTRSSLTPFESPTSLFGTSPPGCVRLPRGSVSEAPPFGCPGSLGRLSGAGARMNAEGLAVRARRPLQLS